mmetsp:Transcript_9758/g.28633  ORF Transcript_9758/g.28633 Transcript_9758/m.28633 type:complete len:287 (+) Transcript_9758:485-1345(+)
MCSQNSGIWSASTAPCARWRAIAASTASFMRAAACISTAAQESMALARAMRALRAFAVDLRCSSASCSRFTAWWEAMLAVMPRSATTACLPGAPPLERRRVEMTGWLASSRRKASSSGVFPKAFSAFTLIPGTRSRKTTAGSCREHAATCRAVRPSESRAFTSHLYLTRRASWLVSSVEAAMHKCSASSNVRPKRAPCWTRASPHSSWPQETANQSGVRPSSSSTLTSAFLSMRYWSMDSCPSAAATCNATLPWGSAESTGFSCSTSFFSSRSSPSATALQRWSCG